MGKREKGQSRFLTPSIPKRRSNSCCRWLEFRADAAPLEILASPIASSSCHSESTVDSTSAPAWAGSTESQGRGSTTAFDFGAHSDSCRLAVNRSSKKSQSWNRNQSASLTQRCDRMPAFLEAFK